MGRWGWCMLTFGWVSSFQSRGYGNRFGWPRTARRAVRPPLTARGWGEIAQYSWNENDVELEVRLQVPKATRAADVEFKVTPRTICVKLSSEATPRIQGTLRGKITLDGTYWSIDSENDRRIIVLRLEKKSGNMYDPEEWMGVILDEIEANATLHYDIDSQEEFDVEEYIQSIGGYNER